MTTHQLFEGGKVTVCAQVCLLAFLSKTRPVEIDPQKKIATEKHIRKQIRRLRKNI